MSDTCARGCCVEFVLIKAKRDEEGWIYTCDCGAVTYMGDDGKVSGSNSSCNTVNEIASLVLDEKIGRGLWEGTR